jgi:uncharacterized protein YndB with AHSA1/START domain
MATGKESVETKRDELIVTRTFNAPVALVWKAFTDPEHLARWWGPKDFTAPSITLDFRVGGKYIYCMRAPDGQEFWSAGTFKEIIPLKKIVYTDSFSDDKGNVVPATHYGMGGDIPLEMQITQLFEESNGKTKLTLIHAGLPFGEMKEMTSAGWNESLDKLAATLK